MNMPTFITGQYLASSIIIAVIIIPSRLLPLAGGANLPSPTQLSPSVSLPTFLIFRPSKHPTIHPTTTTTTTTIMTTTFDDRVSPSRASTMNQAHSLPRNINNEELMTAGSLSYSPNFDALKINTTNKSSQTSSSTSNYSTTQHSSTVSTNTKLEYSTTARIYSDSRLPNANVITSTSIVATRLDSTKSTGSKSRTGTLGGNIIRIPARTAPQTHQENDTERIMPRLDLEGKTNSIPKEGYKRDRELRGIGRRNYNLRIARSLPPTSIQTPHSKMETSNSVHNNNKSIASIPAPPPRLLSMNLTNVGHSVHVSWTIDPSVIPDPSLVQGFVVNYRMEGREDYDSSRLGKGVRTFFLHSLHEDKHYTICVQAIGLQHKGAATNQISDTDRTTSPTFHKFLEEGEILLEEQCLDWSKTSMKMLVGIMAGVIFLTPCIVIVLWVIYKDRQNKKAQDWGSELDADIEIEVHAKPIVTSGIFIKNGGILHQNGTTPVEKSGIFMNNGKVLHENGATPVEKLNLLSP